jgi:hypothetical protein
LSSLRTTLCASRSLQRLSSGLCMCGAALTAQKSACVSCSHRRSLRKREGDARLRADVLAAYGASCVCCGESREPFLTIDHVIPYAQGGGPRAYRAGYRLYGWLKREGYPEGFRVLCLNCNLVRSLRGYCPHELEHSYISFPLGGQSHILVAMDAKMRRAMDKTMQAKASVEIEKQRQEAAEKPADDVAVEKSEW